MTPDLKVEITATIQSPAVSATQVSSVDFLLDSVAVFDFYLFTTTSYGYTISHQITSTNSESVIPPNSPVTGLGAIFGAQFSVDTSSLTSYNFFIYG